MKTDIIIFLAAVTVFVIALINIAPVVAEKEMRRQHFACENMQKRGYKVECQ